MTGGRYHQGCGEGVWSKAGVIEEGGVSSIRGWDKSSMVGHQ